MEQTTVNALALQARNHNRAAREQLLVTLKPRVQTIASAICRRSLDWGNDDELSIALIALNEAIDTYDPGRGSQFISHARTVIHHRLVDYIRREARFRRELLSFTEGEENEPDLSETRQAWDNYQREQEAREHEEMVYQYDRVLREFGITLEDLVAISPRHRDTKLTLMAVAQKLVRDESLLERLHASKKLPIKELVVATGKSRKVLESGRKYIIALALALGKPEFKPISQLIQFPPEGCEAP